MHISTKTATAAILAVIVITILVGVKTPSTPSAQFFAACIDKDGDGFSANCPPRDCDDANSRNFPGADERCFDGFDNNCDGRIDENCPYCTGTALKCYQIKYRLQCSRQVDCDWSLEDGGKCKGVTTPCYQIIDKDYCEVQDDCMWHPVCTDEDRDGFYKESCGKLADCDDFNNKIYPLAQEICDYKDNDCDGLIDEGIYCPLVTEIGHEGISGRSVVQE